MALVFGCRPASACRTNSSRTRSACAQAPGPAGKLPVRGGWQDTARALLRSGELGTREDREVVLHEDDVVVIKANLQASHGYLYVCAYLRPAAELAEAES